MDYKRVKGMGIELSGGVDNIELVMPDADKDGFAADGEVMCISVWSFAEQVDIPLIDLCRGAIAENPCKSTPEVLVDWLRSIANEIERDNQIEG